MMQCLLKWTCRYRISDIRSRDTLFVGQNAICGSTNYVIEFEICYD